jgi:hypothetical protein
MTFSKKLTGALATLFVVSSAPVAQAELLRVPELLEAPELDVSASGTSDAGCWDYKRKERGFARKINGARGIQGVGKVSLDPELSKAARVHTWAMARQDRLYHTPSDTLRHRVTNWTILGENVGYGNTVSSLHEAFMNSPDHRDNILYNTFRHVGIGALKKNGRLWVTVIFEAVSDPGTTLPMPRC